MKEDYVEKIHPPTGSSEVHTSGWRSGTSLCLITNYSRGVVLPLASLIEITKECEITLDEQVLIDNQI
jgi:hypothetical protein